MSEPRPNEYREGIAAYVAKSPLIENPYERESPEALAWERGWKDEWFQHIRADMEDSHA
jgi:hypothetical protein